MLFFFSPVNPNQDLHISHANVEMRRIERKKKYKCFNDIQHKPFDVSCSAFVFGHRFDLWNDVLILDLFHAINTTTGINNEYRTNCEYIDWVILFLVPFLVDVSMFAWWKNDRNISFLLFKGR